MPLTLSRAQAARMAKNIGADPLPPAKPPRPRRVTPDERLCRAGWSSRFRAGIGFDYWQASTTQESAGVAESYLLARRLALLKLRNA